MATQETMTSKWAAVIYLVRIYEESSSESLKSATERRRRRRNTLNRSLTSQKQAGPEEKEDGEEMQELYFGNLYIAGLLFDSLYRT